MLAPRGGVAIAAFLMIFAVLVVVMMPRRTLQFSVVVLENTARQRIVSAKNSLVTAHEDTARQRIAPVKNSLATAREELMGALPPAVAITGANTFYERVYYRANESGCGAHRHRHRRETLVLYESGFSAGPIIQCSPTDMSVCDPLQSLMSLDAMQDLAAKRAFRLSLPHQSRDLHNARILDRWRMSSSTGIVFLDDKHFVAASFGNQKLYLYQYTMSDADWMDASLLDSVDTVGVTELVDYDPRRGMLTSSQYFRGTQELHRVDLERAQLSKYKEVHALAGLNQWCHESAFYPSEIATVIAATSNKHSNKRSLMMRLFDYEAEKVVAEFRMSTTNATRGFHMKSIRFIDSRHFVASMSAFRVGQHRHQCPQGEYDEPDKDEPLGRVVLIRMNFSVEEIVSARRAPAESTEFTVLDFYEAPGLSALDGIAYKDGRAMVADQVNDKLLVFSIHLQAQDPLRLVSERTGYSMPHGVAFSRTRDHFAVTCYGDNSVFVHKVA